LLVHPYRFDVGRPGVFFAHGGLLMRPYHVLRSNFPKVFVELDPLADFERPGQEIVGDAPFLRQHRLKGSVSSVVDQQGLSETEEIPEFVGAPQ
jgi:hypothetical protein